MSTGRSDILFVFPPAPGNAGAFKNHLGVAYLRAALARDGLTTAQYLNRNPGTIDSVAADILGRKSPIVGFTVYDSNARLCIALAQSIKRQNPQIQIVFGGPTATFSARPLMDQHAVIDACVMGEAEETAARIFSELLGGRGLDDTQPGVAFRKDGEVVCTALPPLVGACQAEVQGALDVTPSPYLSGILADGEAGVLTGRGCTHHCQYCCFAALGRMRLRLHSIERVVAELEFIAAQQKRTGRRLPVSIQDDAFTLVPSRARALCQAIAERKLNLSLVCSTRADTVNEELIKLMREAGFGAIAFGLESAVPSVLRATGKVRPPDWHDPDLAPERQFLERLKHSVFLAKKHGFRVAVSIILGLPGETPTDGAETLRFAKELAADSYVHNFLHIYTGTPLWPTYQKYGIACTTNDIGLPETTEYAYDLRTLKPGPNCMLREDTKLVRLLATDAFYSCAASSSAAKGVGTIILEAEELSSQVADWLQSILSVGGLVVQVCPATKGNKNWLTLKEDQSALRKHLVPIRHYIRARLKKKVGGYERWDIACSSVDAFRIREPAAFSITTSTLATPLIAWAKGRQTKANVCEICKYLRQPRQLIRLMDRIEAQDSTCALQQMSAPPKVKYSGRWFRGKAPCLSLTRLEISESGEIRTCRQGESIGTVGDSPKVMSKRLAQLAAIAARRRGCATCQNSHCPRCPFPGMDDRTYCEIMTKQERALRSLDWIQIYSRLPLLLAGQPGN
jgi:radical SAM superfamily enzyme YgiQ (UPF0313 family)